MNYIYDIYLNFNKYLYDFFDWNKNDKITHIKTIPIFKIDEDDLKIIIRNKIKINEDLLTIIRNKTIICNKSDKYKTCALFCDENNIFAIEFDNNGNSINKSTLLIYEELEILETTYKFKTKNIEFKILSKEKLKFKTRKQINDEYFIKNELKSIDEKKLRYIFFECFNKREKNKNIIINKLLNLSNDSKAYKNLYNILKITSTSAK